MKNLKNLNRSEMKKINGGKAVEGHIRCTNGMTGTAILTVDSNGSVDLAGAINAMCGPLGGSGTASF